MSILTFWQWQKGWAVREGDWKLIGNGSRGLGRPKLDKVQLVNLGGEHPEAKNHADERPEIVLRLTRIHQAWAADVFKIYQP